jgi:hypothetical protein
MRTIISLVSAAMALAACTNPTAPGGAEKAAVEAAKARAALTAVSRAPTPDKPGRLSAN